MDAKHWWASRTIWTNIVAGAVSVATAFGLDLDLDPEAQTAIVGGIMALTNIALRLITKSAVTK